MSFFVLCRVDGHSHHLVVRFTVQTCYQWRSQGGGHGGHVDKQININSSLFANLKLLTHILCLDYTCGTQIKLSYNASVSLLKKCECLQIFVPPPPTKFLTTPLPVIDISWIYLHSASMFDSCFVDEFVFVWWPPARSSFSLCCV
jgi:hypothetical protein